MKLQRKLKRKTVKAHDLHCNDHTAHHLYRQVKNRGLKTTVYDVTDVHIRLHSSLIRQISVPVKKILTMTYFIQINQFMVKKKQKLFKYESNANGLVTVLQSNRREHHKKNDKQKHILKLSYASFCIIP